MDKNTFNVYKQLATEWGVDECGNELILTNIWDCPVFEAQRKAYDLFHLRKRESELDKINIEYNVSKELGDETYVGEVSSNISYKKVKKTKVGSDETISSPLELDISLVDFPRSKSYRTEMLSNSRYDKPSLVLNDLKIITTQDELVQTYMSWLGLALNGGVYKDNLRVSNKLAAKLKLPGQTMSELFGKPEFHEIIGGIETKILEICEDLGCTSRFGKIEGNALSGLEPKYVNSSNSSRRKPTITSKSLKGNGGGFPSLKTQFGYK